MTTVSSDEAIAARVLPVLRCRNEPMTCVDLARLVCADSSAIYRVLMNHADVAHEKKSHPLTTFWVRK